MRDADAIIKFGEWLPDLPTLDNPGLTEAKNVIPADNVYKPYLPVAGNGDALAARPLGGFSAIDTSGNVLFYAGTQTKIYVRNGSGWASRYAGTYTTAATGTWSFTQFDNSVIATNYSDLPQVLTVGSGSDFANLAGTGTAPYARYAGVVGRFVVLGDTNLSAVTPNGIQWSAIDDPTSWPTPGTNAAQAVQSGEQFLNSNYGPVTGISNGEQYGLIFQRQGITRMTYVGGDIVFQFDIIERNRGALFPNSIVQFGRLSYFISGDGFYVTDGVEVRPIGSKKVDNYFADTVDTSYKERVRGAIDFNNKCIYWTYPSTTATLGRPNRVLIYNYEENRWARAEDEIEAMVSGLTIAVTLDELDNYFSSIDVTTPSLDAQNWSGGNNTILAFDSSNRLGALSGSAGTAIIDGAEAELFPGRLARIQGVKPLVTGSSPTITVAVGSRNSLGSVVSYTSETTPNPRTGFADFRKESRYHRARVTITGGFSEALGIEYQAVSSGVA